MEIQNGMKIEDLVRRIHTINHFWKSHQSDSDDNKTTDIHGKFFRHMKLSYQIELIRKAYPSVYLELDQTDAEEDIYSVKLSKKIGDYTDAAHMPKRFAEEYLTNEELRVLVRNYS
jgi:hypothetical protein